MLYNSYDATFRIFDILNPVYMTTGFALSNYNVTTESEWDATEWYPIVNAGDKPTWAQILAWYEQLNNTPYPDPTFKAGQVKYDVVETGDHGFWMLMDGRSLDKHARRFLYQKLGDRYTTGSTPTGHFGTPSALGQALIGANNGMTLGETGGAKTQLLSAANIPQLQTSDLPSGILSQGGTNTLLNGVGLNLGLTPKTIGTGQKLTVGSSSPTAINTMPPYGVHGNWFIHIGKLVSDSRE